MSKQKKILLITIGILLCIGITIGVSYAWWTYTATQASTNKINSDCLRIELVDENPITLERAYPITDEEAKSLTPYTFTIKNVCNTSIVYDVNLEVLETNNRLKSEYVAIEFNGGNKRILNTIPKTTTTIGVESYGLGSGSLKGGESNSYSLKLWMDEHVTVNDDAMNKNFESKIVVNASLNQVVDVYTESILNGADPVLSGNLIPVEIGNDGTVTKANIQNEWYNYENKIWANAVILSDKSIEYKDYEVIPESNIESYFVWIPKYSYQLWDLGSYTGLTSIDNTKPHVIPIKFGLNNTSDSINGECTTPMTSGSSGNCKIGDYMTPPAFITMGTNGLWVGKFETGYKGATSTSEAQTNTNINDSTKVQIKPNVYSWRNIQVSNAFQTSYNYQRELDSHMMKNTEWGAVAYLQHSKYGSATSVRINNNSAYITGYAAISEPTCGYTNTNETCNKYESTALDKDGTYTINYKNPTSQVASTTGNYSGIYDMSGGAYEYMMSVMLNSNNTVPLSGRDSTSNSGFNGAYGDGSSLTNGKAFPNPKYYDTYKYDTSYTTYQRRILGDGTSEFGPYANKTYGSQTRQIGSWYNDEARFFNLTYPWIKRGGDYIYGFNAGMFSLVVAHGGTNNDGGFRIVLAV